VAGDDLMDFFATTLFFLAGGSSDELDDSVELL